MKTQMSRSSRILPRSMVVATLAFAGACGGEQARNLPGTEIADAALDSHLEMDASMVVDSSREPVESVGVDAANHDAVKEAGVDAASHDDLQAAGVDAASHDVAQATCAGGATTYAFYCYDGYIGGACSDVGRLPQCENGQWTCGTTSLGRPIPRGDQCACFVGPTPPGMLCSCGGGQWTCLPFPLDGGAG
jgi:hypothetical protein